MSYKDKEKQRLYKQQYYLENRIKIRDYKKQYRIENRLRIVEHRKQYFTENRLRILENKKQYRFENRLRLNEKQRQWMLEHPDYQKEFYKSHPNYHKLYKKKVRETIKGNLDHRMATAIRFALMGNKKGRAWEKLVDYTVDDLKRHLEQQFRDGMNWDKFVRGEIHIDHIIPKASFKYKFVEDEQFKKCWSLENLQPLYAVENRKKGARPIVGQSVLKLSWS